MNEDPGNAGRGGLSWTILAGILVLVLTVGALLWPGGSPTVGGGLLLVFDSSGSHSRIEDVYQPLQQFLNLYLDEPLELVVVSSTGDFRDRAAAGADFVFCPDGLGMVLDGRSHLPVAVGRRGAPRNLRPRGVLVYRKSAGLAERPWLSRPGATVCGDSVSLTATGMWRRGGKMENVEAPGISACAWGPDPYDHAPVLHAARLGAFDYALVRQWDAERFFEDGLMSPLDWGLEIMTIPVPDIVLFAARSVPAKTRLAVGDGLAALGRDPSNQLSESDDLRRGLGDLNLAGFNLLVEPDFDLVRRNFSRDWPQTTH